MATALLLVVALFSVVSFQGWVNDFASSVFVDVDSEASGSNDLLVEDLIGTNLYINAESNSSISKIEVNGVDCNINGSFSGISKIDLSFCLENIDSANANIVVVTGEKVIDS